MYKSSLLFITMVKATTAPQVSMIVQEMVPFLPEIMEQGNMKVISFYEKGFIVVL